MIYTLTYKCNTIPKYQHFYTLMASNGFLPPITLPTRITDTTRSIIDNIYTNTFKEDIFSSKIMIEIAEHLLKFITKMK